VKVPFVDLGPQHAETAEDALSAIRAIVKEGRFILGEPVARFERALADACGVAHAVGVASGTDALVLALIAAGIGAGDLVATTPLTFAATAEAIVHAGARPLFCDIDPGTLCLSPAAVEARIAGLDAHERARVKAIVPVHLFGRACDLEGLRRLGLAIVEDCAQAIGAVGVGALGAFSFFPSKNLGAWGDGGAVTTNDPEIAARVRRLRAHGLEAGRFVEAGYNSRLDAVQAAVLEVKLRRLEAWTRARLRAAARYRERLGPRVRLLDPAPAGADVAHMFVVRAKGREKLIADLAARGVEARAYYATPLHAQPAYRQDVHLPEAQAAAAELVALPMYYGIGDAQIEAVALAVDSSAQPCDPR
jgi:dTDP-4-amino-4,6-dideoxygalactose transaminase